MSNKKIVSLEGLGKRVSNKGCTLFENSKEGVEPRLRGGCSRAP